PCPPFLSTLLPTRRSSDLIGPYPFRYLPHPDPEVLVRVLDREQIDDAWVGHLPSAFHRDPSAGNAALYTALTPYAARLRPVPTIDRKSTRLNSSHQITSYA